MRTLQTISTTDTKYFDIYYHQICMALWGSPIRSLETREQSEWQTARKIDSIYAFFAKSHKGPYLLTDNRIQKP